MQSSEKMRVKEWKATLFLIKFLRGQKVKRYNNKWGEPLGKSNKKEEKKLIGKNSFVSDMTWITIETENESKDWEASLAKKSNYEKENFFVSFFRRRE